MNFFKKLFSFGKREPSKPREWHYEKELNDDAQSEEQHEADADDGSFPISEIYIEDAFKERYIEQDFAAEAGIMGSSLKMLESYYNGYKLEMAVQEVINHPKNLDQVVVEGPGIHAHFKRFGMEDQEIILILAMAFNEFLITRHGFKLCNDRTPEYPLRGMVLQHDNNGAVLSVYPFEFSLKVLQHEGSFNELFEKIEKQRAMAAEMGDLLKKYIHQN